MERSTCETLTASDLGFPDEWPSSSSASAWSLWAVAVFHAMFLAAAVWRDLRMRQQGWWKEEYFLTRDRAHAQVLKLSLATRLRALGFGAWSALRRNEALKALAQWLAVLCVRTGAAMRLRLTELDVQFMLSHMYQVTFANEESAWTRKRNADFLALQLKVQQAITASYADLVSRPSLWGRLYIFFLQYQPHCAVQTYSLVIRCFTRACVVVANIFGRVALSVVVFLLIGDTQPRKDTSCKAAGSSRQYVEGVLGGLGLQLLFSCISRLLQLIWTASLLLFHSREFKQDVEWDSESRWKQVTRWWIQDIAFAIIISVYSLGCCILGTSYIASASDEDGQRWLASFVTMVILTVLVEPLVKSLVAASFAGRCMQEGSCITLQDCLGLSEHKEIAASLDPIREVEETPGAPACPVPTRSSSAPVLKKELDVSPGAQSAPTIHAWGSPGKPRGQRDTWRRKSEEEESTETPNFQGAQNI